MGGWTCHLLRGRRPRDKHVLGEKSFDFDHGELKMSIRHPRRNGEEEFGYMSQEFRRRSISPAMLLLGFAGLSENPEMLYHTVDIVCPSSFSSSSSLFPPSFMSVGFLSVSGFGFIHSLYMSGERIHLSLRKPKH